MFKIILIASIVIGMVARQRARYPSNRICDRSGEEVNEEILIVSIT